MIRIMATITAMCISGCASAWPKSCKYDAFAGETECKCKSFDTKISNSKKLVRFECDGNRLPITLKTNKVEVHE